MSRFADTFLEELTKLAASTGARASKLEAPMSPLEMENKMMQDRIDNINLRVQMDQAQQAEAAVEQQKQMQQQQAMEQQARQQQQQAQQAQQGGGPEGGIPLNPQEAAAGGQ